MSYYEPQAWQLPARQPSWEQPPPPSRSGTSSTSQREDANAFSSQFEEVERAIDNLIKSGKFYASGSGRGPGGPLMGGSRSFEFDPRNRHSTGDFDHRGPPGGHMQNYYAAQRYGGRPSEAEQAIQAKRRMAAQRERELRNYHQEQQYNRSVLADMSASKSERSMSPSTMSEEGRRELIARQHRALYGNEAPNFYQPGAFAEGGNASQDGQGAPGSSGAGRGQSPRGVDPFGSVNAGETSSIAAPTTAGSGGQQERTSSTSPPTSGNATGAFAPFEGTSQQNTSTSPTGADSPTRQTQKSATAPIGSVIAPIGSRPPQGPNQMLNKRSTTPLASPMTFGFSSAEQSNTAERSGSAASNPSGNPEKSNPSMAWGSSSGVWGKNSLGATSVWG